MSFTMDAQIALQTYGILNSRREATKSQSKSLGPSQETYAETTKTKPVHSGES